MVHKILRGLDHLTTQYPDDDHNKNLLERTSDRCLLLTDTITCLAKEQLFGKTGYAYFPRSLGISRLSYVTWMTLDALLLPFLAPIGLIARLFASSRHEGHQKAQVRAAGQWYHDHVQDFALTNPALFNNLEKAPLIVQEQFAKDILSGWIKSHSQAPLPSFLACQRALPLTEQNRCSLLYDTAVALGDRLEQKEILDTFTTQNWKLKQTAIDTIVNQASNTLTQRKVATQINEALQAFSEELLSHITGDSPLLKPAWAAVITHHLLNAIQTGSDSLQPAKARYQQYKDHLDPGAQLHLEQLIFRKEKELVLSLMQNKQEQAIELLSQIDVTDIRNATEEHLSHDQKMRKVEYDLLVQDVVYSTNRRDLIALLLDPLTQEETKKGLQSSGEVLNFIGRLEGIKTSYHTNLQSLFAPYIQRVAKDDADLTLFLKDVGFSLENVELFPEIDEEALASTTKSLKDLSRNYRENLIREYAYFFGQPHLVDQFASFFTTEQGKKIFYQKEWLISDIFTQQPAFMKFRATGVAKPLVGFLQTSSDERAPRLLRTLVAQINEFLGTETSFHDDLTKISRLLKETIAAMGTSPLPEPQNETPEQKAIREKISALSPEQKAWFIEQGENSLRLIEGYEKKVATFKAYDAESTTQPFTTEKFFSPIPDAIDPATLKAEVGQRVGGILLYHPIYDAMSVLTAGYSNLYEKLALGQLITMNASRDMIKIVQRGPRYVLLLNEIHKSLLSISSLHDYKTLKQSSEAYRTASASEQRAMQQEDTLFVQKHQDNCHAIRLSLVFLKWFMMRANYAIALSTSDKK